VSRCVFGALPDGTPVEAVTLRGEHGVSARVITLGASLQSVILPDREGRLADVVLAYSSLRDYLAKPQYFGATVGRFANRVAKGRFTIGDTSYQLPLNDSPHSLHGGAQGFDRVAWTIVEVRCSAEPCVEMQYISPHGDQGYPGRLAVTATYTLTHRNELVIDYRATTDRTTIVNLTNHTYWNLAGEGSGSVLGHRLRMPADRVTVLDPTRVPTGELRAVAGTPFDFRRAKPIGRDIGRDIDSSTEPLLLLGNGYDLNWVVSLNQPRRLRRVAHLEDPGSGRSFTMLSQQPGLQVYTGNFLDGSSSGKSGRAYRRHDAVSLEPQLHPDTPNHPDFGSALLSPGQTYRNLIVYRFAVA
jgi:aldose 1-epimerase